MIHCYQLGGYNIVLDVCSGAVHAVDELAYDMIQQYEVLDREELLRRMREKHTSLPEAELQDCYEQITALKNGGELFTPDVFEPLAGKFKEKSGDVIKALCLHVAHTCNLNCAYCFASQGKYNGERAVMSFEVGKQALDFLVEHSGRRHNLEVDFFGGEPLLAWEAIKEIVAYGRSLEEKTDKKFRFTMTTNGVLLSREVEEFANREMHNVVLSLDGRKQINDWNRPFRGGQGSYD